MFDLYRYDQINDFAKKVFTDCLNSYEKETGNIFCSLITAIDVGCEKEPYGSMHYHYGLAIRITMYCPKEDIDVGRYSSRVHLWESCGFVDFAKKYNIKWLYDLTGKYRDSETFYIDIDIELLKKKLLHKRTIKNKIPIKDIIIRYNKGVYRVSLKGNDFKKTQLRKKNDVILNIYNNISNKI